MTERGASVRRPPESLCHGIPTAYEQTESVFRASFRAWMLLFAKEPVKSLEIPFSI